MPYVTRADVIQQFHIALDSPSYISMNVLENDLRHYHDSLPTRVRAENLVRAALAMLADEEVDLRAPTLDRRDKLKNNHIIVSYSDDEAEWLKVSGDNLVDYIKSILRPRFEETDARFALRNPRTIGQLITTISTLLPKAKK